MGITRDKFLLRHVVFEKRGWHDYIVNYKGQHIGEVVEEKDSREWRAYLTGQLAVVANMATRHNACEALVDAWVSEHGE